jgi:hypothetical protein
MVMRADTAGRRPAVMKIMSLRDLPDDDGRTTTMADEWWRIAHGRRDRWGEKSFATAEIGLRRCAPRKRKFDVVNDNGLLAIWFSCI